MAMRIIMDSIDIEAPRERVWDVLLEDETYRQWTAEFMEGSYAETDWQPGSTVVFRDAAGNGIVGRIVESNRPDLVDIEYDGQLLAGNEDYDSAAARELKGAHETYRLSEQAGGTRLAIESGMADAYFDEMSEAWKRALAKVKTLAEAG